MCLVVEATMLFKIKAVRRDLGKFSRPTQFLILLNLNKLSDCGGEREVHTKECYVQSRNVIDNKWSKKGITQEVSENKSLIKKCHNVIENARDIMILDPRGRTAPTLRRGPPAR
jgi:hypothetical protein